MVYVQGLYMESNYNNEESSVKSLENVEAVKNDVIVARATISCPSCDYKKVFKNSFRRKDMELMVVAFKVFDWLACNKCGDLLQLNLEFQI